MTEWVVTVGMADVVEAMELWCYVAGSGEANGIGWLVSINSEIVGMMRG